MNKDFSIIIGLAIGLVVSGGVVYLICSKKKKKQRVDRMRVLVDKRYEIDNLSGKDLASWFKENEGELNENTQMVVTYASDRILNSLGIDNSKGIISGKDLLQMIYNKKENKCEKIRLIKYNSIELNVEIELKEQNGFIVVTQ